MEVSEVRASVATAARTLAPQVETLSLKDAFAAYAEECGLGGELVGLVSQLEALLDEEEVVPSLPEIAALSAWGTR